jgi:hypothetical protein
MRRLKVEILGRHDRHALRVRLTRRQQNFNTTNGKGKRTQ